MDSKKKEVISRLLLERAPWDSVDIAFAKRIPFDSPADFEDCFCREVVAGEAEALRITHKGEAVGIVILKVDESDRRELVIAGVFCDAEIPLSHDLESALYKIAQQKKCICIRFHTMRAAAARIAAEQYGYRLTEIIMRKDVTAA